MFERIRRSLSSLGAGEGVRRIVAPLMAAANSDQFSVRKKKQSSVQQENGRTNKRGGEHPHTIPVQPAS